MNRVKIASLLVTIAGIAVVVSFLVMGSRSGGPLRPADHPNERGFNSAMIWFELIDSPDELFRAIGDPGSETGIDIRRRLNAMNRVDFFFMTGYSLFYASLFFLLFVLLGEAGISTTRFFLLAGLGLSAAMLAGDINETTRLLELSGFTTLGEVREGAVTALRIWTRVKWFSIFIAGILLAWRYFRYFGAKLSGIIFGLLFLVPALGGFAGFFIPGAGYILEASSNLLGVAWAVALGHGAAVFIKSMRSGKERN
jgi:hypothetical protein